MGGGSQIGSQHLEVEFEFVYILILSLMWLFCVSRLSSSCGVLSCKSEFCNCGHIIA
jgi:hypothetical protein